MAELTYKDAAHLLRRMGFNAPSEDISALVGTPSDKAVDQLIDYETTDDSSLESQLKTDFPFSAARTEADLNDANFNETEIRQWWLERLLVTERPFEEKMTLFWHNFFATSLDKVPVVHMYVQNRTMRQFALSRFDDLLLQVSQGAAMLIYLDGISNRVGASNHNFSRELSERFSMSPSDVVSHEPNYTEQDVNEIARAFAGWRFRKSPDPSPFAYEWFLDQADADSGAKTIFGQTANFTGQDVVTLLADRRATGRYLVYRLFEFFVYPLDTSSADDRATIDRFADVYFANGHSIKELVRAIFKSPEFFGASNKLIKHPVDVVVGSLRILNVTWVFGTFDKRNVDLEVFLRNMGMDLLRPPNVFGWRLNEGFITSQAMIARYNFTDYMIISSTLKPGEAGMEPLTVHVLKKFKRTLANSLVPFTQLDLGPDVLARLQSYMLTDFQGNPIDWDPADNGVLCFLKMLNLPRLLMSLPEFHLN
jgi:uncharacterized protein (DUF1800 family)